MKKSITALMLSSIVMLTACSTTNQAVYGPGNTGHLYSVDFQPEGYTNSYNSEYMVKSSNYYGNPSYNPTWFVD
jgi:hypothetical protein